MIDNIAVLMTAIDSNEQAEILKGIEEYGKGKGCNISVFMWFTGAAEKEKHNLGEVNIANLPELDYFDGVIVFANTLHMECNKKRIIELLEPLTCPIVSIGCELDIENAISVKTDNYAGMKELVLHFINDHKMRDIHFVRGIEGNNDAEERFAAYLDAMKENNIPVLDERITQGDFYVTGGEQAIKDIFNSKLPLPQAVICANDTMAITVCKGLKERGYKVPEDVAIAGYDGSIEGQYYEPVITSVKTDFKKFGIMACEALINTMEGKDVERKLLLADKVMLGESCGCSYERKSSLNEAFSTNLNSMKYRQLLYHMTMLNKDISNSIEYEDWLASMKHYISEINPPEFYCCANENFVKDVFKVGTMAQEDMTTEEMLAYSYNADVVIAYKNGQFRNKNTFPTRYAFDELFKDSEQPKTYFFSPFHYLERNFGYFVFVDCDYLYGNVLHNAWLINMGSAVENIRKQSVLKSAMARLDEMYIKDSLSGVYNRFGMERFYAEIKRKCIMSGVEMQVSFADVDGLKRINDMYGHEEGDRIINATAAILQKYAGKNYVVRYGGDEFVVMGTALNVKEVESYWEYVEREIRFYNDKIKQGAKLKLSYGYDVFEVDAQTNLNECINVIDKKMYTNKNKKHDKQ